MSENWGDLAKSQTDAETIEEAIDRLIQAHDDDPDAHLETGQSLQSHKASEIIDHLANSIVRDKLEFDRYTIDCDFQTIDLWTGDGHYYLESPNEFQVGPDVGIDETALAVLTTGDAFQDQCNFDKSPNWFARIYVEDVSLMLAHIGMFDDDFVSGIGFEISGSKLYAVWFDDEDEKQTYEILSIPDYSAYICRFYYDYSTTTLYFYVNGALVHSIVVSPATVVSKYCSIFVKNVTSAQTILYVSNFHFDADPQI